MCVWSAYAGKKQAAPIMLEAIKKTEGFWAGFYTGLATCHEGKLYFDKCAGHAAIFEKQFNIADYPGVTGIAHSRTNSGGGANRAHPFVGTEGIVALVSQGTIGIFADQVANFSKVARRLYDEGRRMRSGSSTDGARPAPEFIMPDGNQVSLSDVVVNEIESEYMKHGDIVKAMRNASGYMLEESCSICIFADKPGVIGFINMNQRVCYSFEEDGVYMGTTREAFPGNFMEIPGNSVGYVTADGVFHREALGDFKVKTHIPENLVPAATVCLKENPGLTLGALCDKAIRPAGYPKGELDYHTLATYRTIEALISAGMVKYEEVFTPGATGVEGRYYTWSLKEKRADKYAMQPCVYTSPCGKTLNYCRRMMNPELPGDPAVLLFLHGAGERGFDNDKQLVHGAAEVISWCERNKQKVLLLFPQCPENQQWVNTPWDALSHTMPEISEALDLAYAMLDSECGRVEADRKRIYVSGISMGGYGTWDAISRYPETFAAAFPVCGGADTAQAPKLTDMPILTFHGDTDTVVPTSRTRDMVKALKEAGSQKITYIEVPRCGHDSWFTAFRDDASWKWLFEQHK